MISHSAGPYCGGSRTTRISTSGAYIAALASDNNHTKAAPPAARLTRKFQYACMNAAVTTSARALSGIEVPKDRSRVHRRRRHGDCSGPMMAGVRSLSTETTMKPQDKEHG